MATNQNQTQQDPDALAPDKQREYDKDMRDVERQEREVQQRDGGAGIRTTDMPSDKQQRVDTPK